MAIDDLPLPVVNLLDVIGVPWPYIDEDDLRQSVMIGQHGTAFAAKIRALDF